MFFILFCFVNGETLRLTHFFVCFMLLFCIKTSFSVSYCIIFLPVPAYVGKGMWWKLPVTLSKKVVFTRYSGFLYHLQFARIKLQILPWINLFFFIKISPVDQGSFSLFLFKVILMMRSKYVQLLFYLFSSFLAAVCTASV